MRKLTEKRLESIKHQLIEKRDEYLGRTSAIKRDVGTRMSADSAERVVELENSMVLDELNREASEELEKIGIALELIESGDYGICRTCDEKIDYERLAAYPLAVNCLSCEQANERREQMRNPSRH